MKSLRAPWRREYVTAGGPSEGCVLCEMAQDPGNDARNFVLHRELYVYVVLNRYPYINGHLMIVPVRHAGDFSDLTAEELSAMTGLVVRCEKALREGMNCMGMNGGWNLGSCAGAGIEGHIHLHMLPRWPGDTNFLTTAGGTRVISASLEDSYGRLKPFFEDGER